jgi:biotin transport system substrate-specific component
VTDRALPLRLSRPMTAAAVLVMAVLIALGAQVDVPMAPVPMSLQSLAVLLAGALLGWRWGLVSVLLYLLAGGLGLPVFAGGASGWAHFTGPTAGYLVAFPVAAVLMGLASARGGFQRFWSGFSLGLAGHVVLLVLGAAWLATSIGVADAIAAGLMPFMGGAVVKTGVLACVTVAIARLRHHLNI